MIAVENTGPGIPEEDRDRVFDRFYRADRADRARSRGVDGFGLGLSLAKAVVEGHGGEIRIARADEDRTRFEVVLTWWPLGSYLCAIRSLTTLPCTSVRRKSRPA